MSRILYLDCFAGASGDMILGAMLDAGLPLDELQRALGSLALEDVAVAAERVDRCGIAATKFTVREVRDAQPRHGAEHVHGEHAHHSHDHRHHHHEPHDHHPHHEERGDAAARGHHHAHRTMAEIEAVIGRSALSAPAKAKAVGFLRRLGQVEAEIHQTPFEQVHLHEVGALDSLVDIVGSVFGFEWFGADRVVASPLNLGAGTVRCQHGTYPVPAPATARLVAGVPVYSSGAQGELLTPTGALLVTGFAQSFGPVPAMTIDRIGYGAGDRNPPDTPNVLRLLVGQSVAAGPLERVVVVECEMDDMNPQLFGPLMDRLYGAGALEVFYTPVQMKKNRPGTLVTIVAPPARRPALTGVLFAETTTIGVRFHELSRERLDREIVEVATPLGAVRFKIARRGGQILNAAPEFEDCARVAATHQRSIKDVQMLAMKAYLDQAARW